MKQPQVCTSTTLQRSKKDAGSSALSRIASDAMRRRRLVRSSSSTASDFSATKSWSLRTSATMTRARSSTACLSTSLASDVVRFGKLASIAFRIMSRGFVRLISSSMISTSRVMTSGAGTCRRSLFEPPRTAWSLSNVLDSVDMVCAFSSSCSAMVLVQTTSGNGASPSMEDGRMSSCARVRELTLFSSSLESGVGSGVSTLLPGVSSLLFSRLSAVELGAGVRWRKYKRWSQVCMFCLTTSSKTVAYSDCSISRSWVRADSYRATDEKRSLA
mmetsp:Transcript_58714/g.116603  ORF Transcript_58714/g.116603 Transcript_58714/m.116603 type:complete len:273 (-) Transcript_58714:1331-2149(-)